MRDAVICAAVRTPVGKRGGGLSGVHAVDLSAHALKALVERTGIDPSVIDDVHWGCVSQAGEQAGNIGRNAVLAAGWPESIPGFTLDRQCGSSQQTLHTAAASVVSGQQDVVIAGGVEVMSRVPMGSNVGTGAGFPFGSARTRYESQLQGEGFNGMFNQGVGAELMARQWGLSRTAVDEFAVRSHELAAAAQDDGAFLEEIAPITVDGTVVSQDEGIRRGSSVETLAKLKTPFLPDGVITAGNASQISDGAAALLVTTSEKAAELGLTPLARVHATAVVGSDPVMMLSGPIPATAAVLKKSGLSIDDIDTFEVNEAFASVPMAWLAETGAKADRLNPCGGAIALGHPLGGSGARLMTTMVSYLQRTGGRYGLQTMCEGGGMANATIIERL
ncbi:thiolase family protein [Rhodococcus sp. X156]|uniref:thiolase family protein n=1 Tax=Rhodococcus sp. X156 TaxID=2499145 RepID=UPI000FDC2C54|nr:thiolase family protein [Rhodococcus sp. X156]